MTNISYMARYGLALRTNGYALLPIAPGTKKPGRFQRGEWVDYPQWVVAAHQRPDRAEAGAERQQRLRTASGREHVGRQIAHQPVRDDQRER